ncbi:response regulator transcription factor [Nakamurella deserti]|uniref:response regulator transcription factor n=1 Tax=Nakamurella deserti TaxID=2164074 RepID=UPI000DBE3B9D|nr:response regulator [Nakamurella deserti]
MTSTDPATTPVHLVVVADDDAAIRGLVEVAVRKAGARVATAVGDGAAAVAAIRELEPHLAVLDVSMPVMSGLEACQQVRTDPRFATLPVVMLSAAVHPAAVQSGMDAGADLYLEKPFSPRALAATLRELLAQRYGP